MRDRARARTRSVGVKLRQAALIIGLIGLGGCLADATPSATEGPLRYGALGDSYTIGTSVSAAESWPSQLVARLPDLTLVGNLGVDGYTSTDLIVEELPQLAFEISEAAATDLSLVAPDGLHPSGAQYARWVDAILPVARELLLPSPDR